PHLAKQIITGRFTKRPWVGGNRQRQGFLDFLCPRLRCRSARRVLPRSNDGQRQCVTGRIWLCQSQVGGHEMQIAQQQGEGKPSKPPHVTPLLRPIGQPKCYREKGETFSLNRFLLAGRPPCRYGGSE